MPELTNKRWVDSAWCRFTYIVLEITLFNLLYVNTYGCIVLFEVIIHFTQSMKWNQASERAEIESVHFRTEVRSLEIACTFPRWWFNISSSSRCGLIHDTPSPVGKSEKGNCIIMALECFLFVGNYNEFLPDPAIDQEPGYRSQDSDWLRAGWPRSRSSRPGRGKNFLFSMLSRPALGPTQSSIQWVPGALSPGVKPQGCEADHSPPASAGVKKMWIYTSTPRTPSWHSA
jgi:hypothetical protein